ncbi:MAG: acylneuraminate cytidylyltransferase family protein [Candidatus Thorarchaeota archaeon]
MRILGLVCARGGSKGVKNKNIRELDGKPLLYYTIDVLKRWGKADRIVCSTDSSEIAELAREFGAEVPFLRPANLSTDTSSKIPVLQHALRFCEEEENIQYDALIDLQPTSPLRNTTDIDGAFNKFLNTKADVLYTVYESRKNPYFTMVELDENNNARLSKELESEFVRRQDSPKVYSINGSIYIFAREQILKAKGLHCENEKIYIMDEVSSIDIDTELEFQFAEFLLKSGFYKF